MTRRPVRAGVAALAAWGPTSIHRRAWVFMDHLPWGGVPRFVRPDPQLELWEETADFALPAHGR